MDSAHICSLLERPSRDRRPLLYQIRDEAGVLEIVAALRASPLPHIRRTLCYILQLRAGAESFEGQTSETRLAVPALIEMLTDPEVCEEAIDALGYIGDPTAGPALLELYHNVHADSGLHVLLASVMGFCQYRPAISTLIEALTSSDSLLRRQASRGLQHLKAQEAIAPLRQALATETDALTRQTMQETLQEIEHPTSYAEKISHLITQLKDAKSEGVRESAARALGDMDERVLVPLLTLLHDERCEVRQYATIAISGLSEHRDADWFVHLHREPVQAALIQMLADQDSKVRAAAAQALDQWGDEHAIEALLTAIQDDDVEVRRAAVETLRYPKDERALEPLLNAFLNDADRQVRSYAAQGLGWHVEDNRAVNTLIQELQDKQSDVRRQAAELLTWLTDERATDALIQALQDDDQEVREWAIEALWQLCISKNDALSTETMLKMHRPLIQAVHTGNEEARACAEKILAWLD